MGRESKLRGDIMKQMKAFLIIAALLTGLGAGCSDNQGPVDTGAGDAGFDQVEPNDIIDDTTVTDISGDAGSDAAVPHDTGTDTVPDSIDDTQSDGVEPPDSVDDAEGDLGGDVSDSDTFTDEGQTDTQANDEGGGDIVEDAGSDAAEDSTTDIGPTDAGTEAGFDSTGEVAQDTGIPDPA